MPLRLLQITRAAAARPLETTPMAVHSLNPPTSLQEKGLPEPKGPADGPEVGTWTRMHVVGFIGYEMSGNHYLYILFKSMYIYIYTYLQLYIYIYMYAYTHNIF